MEERRTRYPGFNVLTEAKAWDPHTRKIILERLGPFAELKFFQPQEAAAFKTVAGHLAYDQRDEILKYIVSYADQRLASTIGENQRKPGIPREADLVRVSHPVRRDKDHFVARIEQDLHRVVHRVLGAAAHHDLLGGVGQAVFPLELADDRLTKVGRACAGGVLREALLQRLDGGAADRFRRVEIRLAGGEGDHVDPLRFHRVRFTGDREGRGRL